MSRFGAWLSLSVMLMAGCSSGDNTPPVYPIRGTVTVDGQPLPTGTILLKDPAGQQKTCIATIKDGAISGSSTAGEKSLEISAIRIAKGKTIPGADGKGTEAAVEQYLPERYNTKTTLTMTIAANDQNELKFDLESK